MNAVTPNSGNSAPSWDAITPNDSTASTPGTARPGGDAGVRNSYNTHVSSAYEDAFKVKFKEFHDNEQCFGEELAREAFDARTKIKEEHQAQTSIWGRAAIWIRNLFTYGGANASYEGLSKSKTPEEIGYSAFKTDGRDLGLAGNGFGDKLAVWNAIKEVSTLYPEDISPAMLAEYQTQLNAAKNVGTPFTPNVHTILAAGGHAPDPILAAQAAAGGNARIQA